MAQGAKLLGLQTGAIRDEEEYLEKMGDRQDLRINLTKFDDKFLMDYATEKLMKLNKDLGVGLSKENLIKTKNWRGKQARKVPDNFMEDFGIAAQVLRDSNFS